MIGAKYIKTCRMWIYGIKSGQPTVLLFSPSYTYTFMCSPISYLGFYFLSNITEGERRSKLIKFNSWVHEMVNEKSTHLYILYII